MEAQGGDERRDVEGSAQPLPAADEGEGSEGLVAAVWSALGQVQDPELGVGIVDLGLVYGVYVGAGGYAEVTMTATTPGCPLRDALGRQVEEALCSLPWVRRAVVNWAWSPPWSPERITPAGLRQLGWR